MSRVIKFRAWDTKREKMIPIDTERLGQYLTLDHYVPMQFTGLLDKNGREIYEGDLVAAEDGRVSSIVWEAPQYIVRHHPEGGSDFLSSKPLKFVVIGNIYENPDLLK